MLSNPYLFVVATVFLIPGALLAILAHEFGHGLAADRMGDRTPRNRGYLSLANPRKFFTPYGLVMMAFWHVGWGERVPVNEYRQTGIAQKLLYDLAGPAANLLLAVIFGLATRPLIADVNPTTVVQAPLNLLATLLYAAYFANLAVMAFNLLPVPGFDGWRILETLLRRRFPRFFLDVSTRQMQIQQVLILGLFIGQFVAGNLLNVALVPFYAPAATVILGGCSGYLGLMPCLPSAGL